MEKENVLEIEITKIDDNYSYCRIKHQNESILKTDGFDVTFLGSLIFYVKNGTPSFYTAHDTSSGYDFGSLRIKGSNNSPFIINNNEIKYLNELVDLINEKYGTPKRWRAEENEEYYFLDGECDIWNTNELKTKSDDNFFELGNYFKTKEEAEKVKIELDKFWEKVRNGEIGGDE